MSLAMSTDAPNPYVVGETDPRRKPHATLETKPSVHGYTGGGYEHWRSSERRPHTPAQAAEDVYTSHHRLLAVVACYPLESPIEDVLDDLHTMDVHHHSGVPWDNRPGNLEVVAHGRHAEITQTQRRASAADTKRELERAEQQPQPDRDQTGVCDRCGRPDDTLAESAAWPDERRCLDCATETADGQEIQL
jgi:hypothetical protein